MAPDSLLDDVVTANHILTNIGFVDAYGHVSARDPDDEDVMIISGYKPPAMVTRDDLVRMTMDGELLTEGVEGIYSENVIHRAIYRARPDVQSVVHGHPPPLIPFTVTDAEVKPVTHQGSPFHEGVPTFSAYDDYRGRLIVTEEEGDRMAAVLGGRRAQLLKQHGANVVGSTVREATMLSSFLMSEARHQLAAMAVGEPDYFTEPEDAIRATVEDTILRPRVVDRAWDYLVYQLPG